MTTEDNIKININKENYKVVKSNYLIQKMAHTLTAQEQKIILYLISQIKPENIELPKYKIKLLDFLSICNISRSGKKYKQLKDTLIQLSNKCFWSIDIEKPQNEFIMRWVSNVYIDNINNCVEIELSQYLKPYLLELKEKFTVYKLKNILQMKSKYSINLYELLKSHQKNKYIYFSIDKIKELLNANIYNRFSDFNRKVIITATSEINNLSDLYVEYIFEKTKNKITKIKFIINSKNIEQKDEIISNIEPYIELNAPECPKNPQEDTSSVKSIEPSIEEINAYIAKYELSVDVPRFRAYYASMDWLEKGEPVNWKKKLSTWQDMKTQFNQSHNKSKDIQGKATYTPENLMNAEYDFFLNN